MSSVRSARFPIPATEVCFDSAPMGRKVVDDVAPALMSGGGLKVLVPVQTLLEDVAT